MKRIIIFCVSLAFLTGYGQENDFCITYPSGKTLCYLITSPNTVKIGGSNKQTGTGILGVGVYDYDFVGSLTVPATVTDNGYTYTVTNVDNLRRTNLTSVKLPETITIISKRAFSYCKKLTEINFPNSLDCIAEESFWGCAALTSVNIPSSVRYLGSGAFRNCNNLISVTIGSEIMAGSSYAILAGGGAFQGCENLQKVVILSSVRKIGLYSFLGCINLKDIIIEDGVEIIGRGSFAGCSSLGEVVLPSSTRIIESEAFLGCSLIRNIIIPDGCDYLGTSVFEGCRRLRTVKLPKAWCEMILAKVQNPPKTIMEHPDPPNFIPMLKSDLASIFADCPSLEKIIIPMGMFETFATLLPEYKDKLEEEIASDDSSNDTPDFITE